MVLKVSRRTQQVRLQSFLQVQQVQLDRDQCVHAPCLATMQALPSCLETFTICSSHAFMKKHECHVQVPAPMA